MYIQDTVLVPRQYTYFQLLLLPSNNSTPTKVTTQPPAYYSTFAGASYDIAIYLLGFEIQLISSGFIEKATLTVDAMDHINIEHLTYYMLPRLGKYWTRTSLVGCTTLVRSQYDAIISYDIP